MIAFPLFLETPPPPGAPEVLPSTARGGLPLLCGSPCGCASQRALWVPGWTILHPATQQKWAIGPNSPSWFPLEAEGSYSTRSCCHSTCSRVRLGMHRSALHCSILLPPGTFALQDYYELKNPLSKKKKESISFLKLPYEGNIGIVICLCRGGGS